MKKITTLLLLIITLGSAQAQKTIFDRYIDRNMPLSVVEKYFDAENEFFYSGGTHIGYDGLNNGLSYYDNPDNAQHVVVFSEIYRRGGVLHVKDYLIIEDLNRDGTYFSFYENSGFGDDYCAAFALYDTSGQTKDEFFTKALRAWGVRKDNLQIEEISTEGLKCLNEDYKEPEK